MGKKLGRPPIQNWQDRQFYRALDTHGGSTVECWLPKPGERVNPSAQVSVEIDGEWRKMTVRRFLYSEVMRTEQADWTELSWNDIVIAADSCNPACLNPWHQVRMTREEHAELLRARWDGVRVPKVQDAKEAQIDQAAEALLPRYVAGRIVLLGTGNGEWAAEVEKRRDTSDEMADALREKLLAAYPRYRAAFDAVPMGTGPKAMAERRRIVRHFWKTYPGTEQLCDDTGATQYLLMAWSVIR